MVRLPSAHSCSTVHQHQRISIDLMKLYACLTIFSFVIHSSTVAQNMGIGTSTPNVSAILDIQSTDKGLLIPRMTTSQIQLISTPAKGLMVYDSVKNQLMVNMGTPEISDWQTISFHNGWSLWGNGSTNSTTHFIGTTDNQPLQFLAYNKAGELNPSNGSIFWGRWSGYYNGSNVNNIAIGTSALVFNTNKDYQIAIGDSAMIIGDCTSEDTPQNIAIGTRSMFWNSCGSENTALGPASLVRNSVGNQNTAIGTNTLFWPNAAHWNTAIGVNSLVYTGYPGNSNTGLGRESLFHNYQGARNTATGNDAMHDNQFGNENTVIGANAMYNGDDHYNTGVGSFTLYELEFAQFNTAIGYFAGNTYPVGWNNTLVGTGSDVVFAGQYNTVALGSGVECPDHSMVRIGNSLATSIGGYADWTNISDGRYKNHIQDNVTGIDFIMRLRPVTYHLDFRKIIRDTKEEQGYLKNDLEQLIQKKEACQHTGFIAQEIEEAALQSGFCFNGVDKPRNENGFYGLRYASLVVPLVKALQELNVENQLLKSRLEEQTHMLNSIIAELELLEK